MVASQAEMQGANTAAIVEMLTAMEASAEREEWDHVEDTAAKLRHALLQVPEQERRDAVLQVRRALDRIREHAQQARDDVAERLSALRRGRDATRAYGTAASASGAELR